MRAAHAPSRVALAWIALAFLAAWWLPLGWRDLIDPDEGRYAEIAREMLASGDWLTPRLDGVLYFEKPPLGYWAGALAMAALGVNEAAARTWPALAGLLGVAAVAFVAHRAWGARSAAIAALVLGSSLWWVANGHFLNLDMGLSAWLTVALAGFWYAQRDDATAREITHGMLATWAAMALATLAKGLVGVLIPGAVLVLYTLVQRDARPWTRMRWGAGLALYLAIAAPWFVAMSMRHPEFARFFFVHEHVERFLTPVHRRTAPAWTFVPIVLAGALPWTTLLPGALARAWRRGPGRFQPGRLLVLWATFVFAFFSASSSKLPSYVLPMFGALALVLAHHAAACTPRRIAAHAMVVAAIAIAFVAAIALAPHWLSEPDPQARATALAYRPWLLAAGLVALAGSALCARIAWRGSVVSAIAVLAFASLVAMQVGLTGHRVYARTTSAHAMARAAAPHLGADTPVYSVEYHDQTLPFYLRRPVTLVAYRDEFDLGLTIEPGLGLPTREAFVQAWGAATRAGATMQIATFEALQGAGLPMRVVYRDSDRVFVVKP